MEHPVEQHTEQLISMRRDIDDHEERLRSLELVSSRREEQVRGLYENVGAIKELLAQQTMELRSVMSSFDSKVQSMLADIDKRLKTLETADGKKWQNAVWIVFAAIAGAILDRVVRGG